MNGCLFWWNWEILEIKLKNFISWKFTQGFNSWSLIRNIIFIALLAYFQFQTPVFFYSDLISVRKFWIMLLFQFPLILLLSKRQCFSLIQHFFMILVLKWKIEDIMGICISFWFFCAAFEFCEKRQVRTDVYIESMKTRVTHLYGFNLLVQLLLFICSCKLLFSFIFIDRLP